MIALQNEIIMKFNFQKWITYYYIHIQKTWITNLQATSLSYNKSSRWELNI